jgi:xyloglucan-specific endo-beta-1,4-glucanase
MLGQNDVWFSSHPEGDPSSYSPSGGFLMVWLHKPAAAQPIGGAPQYTSVTISGVPGTWDIWIGPNGSVPVVSYVRTDVDPTYSMSFDLNAFIRDAVENRPGTLTDVMYLTNIFTGFEIWSGGVGLQTTSFCAGVN